MKLRWGAALLALTGSLLPAVSASAATLTVPSGLKATDHGAICAIAPGRVAAQNDGALRVATLNTLHSETDEGDRTMRDRVPLLVRTIVESGADIVGLQEVTENKTFDGKNEYPQKHGRVARRIAEGLRTATGEPWTWCYARSNPHVPFTPEIRSGGGNVVDDLAAANGNIPEGGDFAEGLAVVTRFTVAEARARRLLPRSYEALACTSPDPFCRLGATFDARQVLWARVKTPHGMVDTFNTHLAHGLTPASTLTQNLQMRQAIGVVQQYARPDGPPDFLLGDFNNPPDSTAVRIAKSAGFVDTYARARGPECVQRGDLGCSGGPTDGEESFSRFPTRPMRARIDYVMARPRAGCALKAESRRIADVPEPRADGRYLWPSDHYGFVSTVTCG